MAIILHVDDSSFSRTQIRKILIKAGHTVLEADSGISALALLQSQTPDLIISDILMPAMDGIQFLTALKEQDNSIPVIMLTADIQDDTKKTCFNLGARNLLNKPPKEEDLLTALQNALKQEA